VSAAGALDFARRSELERGLLRAEAAIALLERVRPLNGASERARLLEAWRSGRRAEPAFQYAPAPGLAELCAGLEAVGERLLRDGGWGRLYGERALELALEARAVELVGTPAFAACAAQRFPEDSTAAGRLADEWSAAWCRLEPADRDASVHVSDDERDPLSLIARMRHEVGVRRLPFRVVARAELATLAATADGVIFVRAQARHGSVEAVRIVVHEIEGHALPSVRSSSEELGLFALGSAGGSDDQEGRALWLEERSGTFDDRRRALLGRRHAAARALRRGATWVETVELLLELGSELAAAIDLASRIHRGGGLGREIVYLPALARVRAASEAEPWLMGWLERGRISLAAARTVARLGDSPPPRAALPAA
jgi:hypothetical protein